MYAEVFEGVVFYPYPDDVGQLGDLVEQLNSVRVGSSEELPDVAGRSGFLPLVFVKVSHSHPRFHVADTVHIPHDVV